ncbi:uncharacterized protein LOC128251090 [Octopus bimaculoides]|uniref:uncharacterized protein LOC128251090 n=1 Tax=Octopus bimaculoides TaxID=37653 RepID=UPI0022E689CC|nr:uncharacterized protein LOC128251090 [Octopus bimaculoides]
MIQVFPDISKANIRKCEKETHEGLCVKPEESEAEEMITLAKLIVWDEATTSHKAAFEALDTTLQDFKNNKKIMDGVTLLMAGDFRQTLPVIPRGTRADELRACIRSSYIWQHVKQLTLTTNMRVHIRGDLLAAQFSNNLLDIGNGKLPQDPEDSLHHLPCGNMTASLEELKSKVFPNIATNYKSHKWLSERTILAPRNDAVDKLNLNLLPQLPGPECSYRSIDTVPDQEQFKRLQFPVKPSFAMSINKAHGQSLKVVGLNLLQPCFSHGQLYVGCSRTGEEKNIYILSDKHGKTENTVYEEALP